MLSDRSSPAVISAAAATKLPRMALLTVLLAFIIPMLFSSDIWSGKTMSSFGIAWNMVNGGFNDWLMPNIDGKAITTVGPFSYWIAALVITFFQNFFGAAVSYHLTAAFWFVLTTASIWYGTYLLAERDEAQPLSFAFGGEAARRDYGRLVADIATLMTVGSYGLVAAFFELNQTTALLALSALSFYGIVLSLQRLWAGSIIAGISIGIAALSTTLGVGLWFTFAAWLAIYMTPDYTSRTQRAFITLTAAFVTFIVWPVLIFLSYPDSGATWFSSWLASSYQDFAPMPFTDYPKLAKNLIWLTFPVWPFAMWGIYAWRQSLRTAPLAIPLSFLTIALFSILFTGIEATSTILSILPSMAVLSAFGIVSLRRSKENFLDLYSGVVCTLGLIAAWLYFFAWTTGQPSKMAYSLIRLAPHISHGTSLPLFALAVFVSLVWLAQVFWRLFKHPIAIWRGAWLSAAGLTSVWIVVMCLFVNIIDGARSMKAPVNAIKTAIQPLVKEGECVSAYDLSASDLAALQYWGNLHFDYKVGSCNYLLTTVNLAGSLSTPMVQWSPYQYFTARPRADFLYVLLKKK